MEEKRVDGERSLAGQSASTVAARIGGPSGSFAWLLGQMFFIPLRTVLYGMEMLVGAMRGLQDASDRGLTVLAGSETDSEGESEATVISNDAANSGKENEVEEIKRMDDK